MLNFRELFDPLRDFLKPIIDRYGIKFLVVLLFIGSVTWLIYQGFVPGFRGVLVEGAVVVVFLIVRTWQKKIQNGNSIKKEAKGDL